MEFQTESNKNSEKSSQNQDSKLQDFYKEVRSLLEIIEKKHTREQDKLEKRYITAIKIFLVTVKEELELLAASNNKHLQSRLQQGQKSLTLEQLKEEYTKTLKENKELARKLEESKMTIADLKIKTEVDERIIDFHNKKRSEIEGELKKYRESERDNKNNYTPRSLFTGSSFSDLEENADEITLRIHTILKNSHSIKEATLNMSNIFKNFKEEIKKSNTQKVYSERRFNSLQEKYCNLLSKQSQLFTTLKKPSELATIFNKCVQSISKNENFLDDENYLRIIKDFLVQKPIQNLLGNFIKGKSCCSHEDCLNNLARISLFSKTHIRNKSDDYYRLDSGIGNKKNADIKNKIQEIKNSQPLEEPRKSIPKINRNKRSLSACIKPNKRIINKFEEARTLIEKMNDEPAIPKAKESSIKFTYDGIKVPSKGNAFHKFFFKDKKEMFHLKDLN